MTCERRPFRGQQHLGRPRPCVTPATSRCQSRTMPRPTRSPHVLPVAHGGERDCLELAPVPCVSSQYHTSRAPPCSSSRGRQDVADRGRELLHLAAGDLVRLVDVDHGDGIAAAARAAQVDTTAGRRRSGSSPAASPVRWRSLRGTSLASISVRSARSRCGSPSSRAVEYPRPPALTWPATRQYDGLDADLHRRRVVPRETAKLSVFDHGLLYGDGVFEGIRVYNRRIFRLERPSRSPLRLRPRAGARRSRSLRPDGRRRARHGARATARRTATSA